MFTKGQNSFIVRFPLALILISGMLNLQPVQRVLAATLTVTNTNDSGAGSLRQAITDAAFGDTIRFDPLLAGQTITLASDLVLAFDPLVEKKFTIDGSGVFPQVIISGGNVAHIKFSSNSTVTISDLTITNGYGSAIESGGNLTIINSTLKNNDASNGGAIRNSGNLTIKSSTITQNQAQYEGGAILIEGFGITTIINSTITQNQAGGDGGGITIRGNAEAEIINSTFAGNSAPLLWERDYTKW
jgi:hypothetical protein